MNQKIDPNNASLSEFSPEYLRWFSLTTLGTLLVVLVSNYGYYPFPDTLFHTIFHPPAVQASGVTISMGMSEFSGHTPYTSPKELFSIIIALVLLYLIGPVLWLYSWRVLKQKEVAGTTITKIFHVWSLLFILGGALTFRTVIGDLILTTSNRIISAYLYKAQDVQRTKDQLISNLIQVAFEASEYRILPKSMNGGSGSYEGFCLSPQRTKNDLGEFTIINVRPPMITFLAVSSKNNVNTVMVTVDSIGQMCHWTFSGDYK
ncbi:MAG: hypothetical protein NTX44_10445 [Ignavibacteriales bacterium]|nr:hypothetical protein [Ignavibacteriales bacterium]